MVRKRMHTVSFLHTCLPVRCLLFAWLCPVPPLVSCILGLPVYILDLLLRLVEGNTGGPPELPPRVCSVPDLSTQKQLTESDSGTSTCVETSAISGSATVISRSLKHITLSCGTSTSHRSVFPIHTTAEVMDMSQLLPYSCLTLYCQPLCTILHKCISNLKLFHSEY
jgi:hypothetical protein